MPSENTTSVSKREMADLISDLVGHLDFCGWGDAYERSAAEPLQARAMALLDRINPPAPPHHYVLDGGLVALPKLCPVCERRFVTNQATRNHMRDKHGLIADRMLRVRTDGKQKV